LGAHVLNQTVPEAIKNLSEVQVRHQTGAGHLSFVKQTYVNHHIAKEVYQVTEFIEDMPAAYDWADLVICRAGALTVAEVAAAGVPAVFVPLPHAVDDHQTKNALVLVSADAAYLLPQSQLTPQRLKILISDCLRSPEILTEMGKRAKTVARLDAANTVANFCIELSEQRA
jgi:UDP-N-acetylglucosamine--N-acetylmuramyl-(pentapeptide) pyrophosphoryl-undecaprenol N-acetylglucosamine transferase